MTRGTGRWHFGHARPWQAKPGVERGPFDRKPRRQKPLGLVLAQPGISHEIGVLRDVKGLVLAETPANSVDK